MDFSKLTKTEIAKMVRKAAPIANAKLKSIREQGYEKYNYSMVRKYNTLTTYSEYPNLVTKKNLFRSGSSHFTKEQLIKRYELMTEFINNDYATVAYTQRHLTEMRDKWSLDDDEIKTMFDLYREYGYDNFTDSDGVLASFSKIMNDSKNQDEEMEGGEYLQNVLNSIADELDNMGKSEEDYIAELRRNANILTY